MQPVYRAVGAAVSSCNHDIALIGGISLTKKHDSAHGRSAEPVIVIMGAAR
jgi:hypothetical protein